MKTLGPGEVKSLSQEHTAYKYLSWDLNPGLHDLKSKLRAIVLSQSIMVVCMQRYKNSKACDLNQWVFNETVYIQHQPRQKVGGFEWKNQSFHALT